jgi:3-phosphoshikimate 1-carboxyvinyltransferase
MASRTIQRFRGRLDAVVEATSSKSVTHRALIVAALASGTSTIRRALDADDTRVTRRGLEALGVGIRDDDGCWVVEGCGGRPAGGGRLRLGESGTSMRLLTAVAALGRAPSELDGAPRLRERPMQELATALGALGAEVRLGTYPGGLPLTVGGRALHGGEVRVAGSRSSQFASALLLIGSSLPEGLELTIERPVVSRPYVRLTADVLAEFGVVAEEREACRWSISPGTLEARDYVIEGDHSSASYFLALACILGGRVRVTGLRPGSAQPDSCLATILERLGCNVSHGDDWVEVIGGTTLRGFDLDVGDAPDLVPTLAVLGLFADGPSRLRGVAHLRLKESDRLAVLAENLTALGRPASADADSLSIGPAAAGVHGGSVKTASDHRMAMAFGIAGLRIGGVTVDDAGCVSKSNPAFWDQLDELAAPAD